MAQLESVWSLAVEIWEDEATAAEFLGRRHAMLQDRRPLDAILESEDGAVSVREILGRLKYGTAA
jgi:putative toxin-antitoxin system antitoxin component (TIGR02293 family)